MRHANWVMAIAFAVSAALQWNDPDPLGWMAVYSAAASVCVCAGVAALGERRLRWLAAVVGTAACVWGARLAPSVVPGLELGDLLGSMKASRPEVEQGRELLGLVLIAAWMVAIAVKPPAAARSR